MIFISKVVELVKIFTLVRKASLYLHL